MLTEPQRDHLAAAPPRHRETKIAGIEMLRAVAVLMVLVQHLPGMLPELGLLWLPGRVMANFNGGAGVDIFFCVSGFVVTRGLLRDVQGLDRRRTFAVTLGFWIRRAFRLWPSAWLWLIAAYAVSVVFNRLGVMDPSANLHMIPAGIGMYSNYLLIHASRAHQNLGVMSQYWSLSLEEQFYLALPLLLLLLGRRATLPLLILYAGFRFFDYRDFWADLYLRPGCLVAGVGLAYLEGGSIWRRVQRMWPPGYAGVVVCATLILLAAVFDSIAPFERWLGVAMFKFAAPLETAACALIVLVAVQCSAEMPGVAGRVLLYVGSRSYAIYIVHQLAYAVTREIDGRMFSGADGFTLRLVAAFAISSTLIVAATEFTVRHIEHPMRARGRLIAERVSERWSGTNTSAPALSFWRVARSPCEPLRHNRRIIDIEALRSIAIFFVMIEHMDNNLLFWPRGLQWFLSFGGLWPGVDLFFVISGFLVTRDLLRRLGPHPSGLQAWRAARQFWVRRAWRLWPTAWLWLGIIVVGSALFTNDLPFLGPLKANVRGLWAGVFFYANLRSARVVWDPYGAGFPYWSLSLEEQFYFVLPLSVLLLGRVLPFAALVCIAIQFPLAHDRLYYFFRSDALLWGVVLATWYGRASYLRYEPTVLRSRPIAVFCVIAALATLFRLATPGNVSPPFTIGIIAAISMFLVWVASYDRHYICPKWASRLVLWTGSRSYAIYVAHVPVFNCSAALAHYLFTPGLHPFTGAGNPYALVIVGPLLVGSTELTYRYVEQPLRRIGARMTNRSTLLSA